MSLRVLTQVWEHARAQGGDLLVLLALADEARDNGGCYPGIDRIAKKARMTERNVRYVLRRLEQSGELVVVPGGGRANTNLYEIRVTPNLDLPLPERGQTFPKPGKSAPERGQSTTETRKPAAPEPLDLKATNVGGGPSPTAQCAEAYRHGIKTRYQADYPGSAKLNGMMSQLVKELGADPALAVVKAYMASTDPWYLKKRHALEYLKRDAAQIWIQLQERSGQAARGPAIATAYMEKAGGAQTKLRDYPVDEPERLARKVLTDYGQRLPGWEAKNIIIEIGARRHPFSIAELRA